jgi:hypothetical protein
MEDPTTATTQAVLIFNDVPVAEKPYTRPSPLSQQIAHCPQVMEKGDTIHYCNDSMESVHGGSNGLMFSIIHSYNQHLPLVLRPDDIWHVICIAFGKYVETHAEAMRYCFVSHEGKKKLSIIAGESFHGTTPADWEILLTMMQNEIGKHVKTEIMQWLTPEFSTTTTLDHLVANIALMSTMKQYFSYGFEFGCGLTTITLKGTLKDWNDLVTKSKYLRTFNQPFLDQWADLLIPVLENFADAYSRAIRGQEQDKSFWQRICTSKRRGSGGQQTYLGWFMVFTPLDNKGRYQLKDKQSVDTNNVYAVCDDDSIPIGICSVPVDINDNGTEIQTKFFAGSLTVNYDPITKSFAPGLDWGILKTNANTAASVVQA